MNQYSCKWFEMFAKGIDEAQTQREVNWIVGIAPPEAFPRVLDLCCGHGRHAKILAAIGYRVTGVDRDNDVIRQARQTCPDASFIVADVRDINSVVSGPFDLVTILWQSFGYFDDAGNRTLLRSIRSLLRSDGRLILDVYDADFFSTRLSPREYRLRDGEVAHETKTIIGGRLTVRIAYADGHRDAFDWQIFRPDELAAFANDEGFSEVSRCAGFEGAVRPAGHHPRMQFIFRT